MEHAGSKEGSDLNASNSPPRRRRSTFFERRCSLVPTLPSADNDAGGKDTHKEEATNECKQQYLKHISEYHGKLYEEKEAWKCEARERRHQCRDIKDQLRAAASGSLSTPIDYSVLTKEDIDFLKGKPNISKIAETSLDLKQQVGKTVYFMKRLKELNERVLCHCEERFNFVHKYVLENSTIENFEEHVAEKKPV